MSIKGKFLMIFHEQRIIFLVTNNIKSVKK